MIILSRRIILESLARAKDLHSVVSLPLFNIDEGDGFISVDLVSHQRKHHIKAEGLLRISDGFLDDSHPAIPIASDVFIVAAVNLSSSSGLLDRRNPYRYQAWVNKGDRFQPQPVEVIDVEEEIFSRIRGLYETDVLRAKRVLIVGVGSGGSTIALELAKAGVGNFILVDHQRLEVPNIVRHTSGFSDLGRFKTKAVRDQILEKNPGANVETFEKECDWDWLPQLEELVKRTDVVFCCTDNRPSRILVNLASIANNRVCIYGGTFNRAYGGHALRVIPKQSMCYQCFIDLLPEKAADQEIASDEQAERIAYDDRQVAVEPGLANDIAPVSNMCVKLGVLELLRGTNTAFVNLYEDLSNAWYQWLNRREADTEYSDLQPMDSGDNDGIRILAWYGIANDRNPGCPVCGDFVQLFSNGVPPSSEQIDAFAPQSDSSTDANEFPASD